MEKKSALPVDGTVKRLANWLTRAAYNGIDLPQAWNTLINSDKLLSNAYGRVRNRNASIAKLEKELRASKYHVEAKERTIERYKRELGQRKSQIVHRDQLLNEAADTVVKANNNVMQIMEKARHEIAELKRQRKCLNEQVRVRNIKIKCLETSSGLAELKEKNRELFNKYGEVKIKFYNEQMKHNAAKRTIRRLMRKAVK